MSDAPITASARTPIETAEQAAVPRPSRVRSMVKVGGYLPPVLLIALLVTAWELFNTVTGSPDYVLPPLHDILSTAIVKSYDKLIPAAWVTAKEMLLGFFLGTSVGMFIGILVFYSLTMRRALMPIVVSSQAIPVIAIAPLFIIWFGFGITPKVLVAAIIVFFPVTMNFIAGLDSVDRDMVRLMRSLGANEWKTFWFLRLPQSSPMLLTGIKNAAALSAIGAIVGEWVGSDSGLGPTMIAANAGFKTDMVFAAIFYLSALALALFGVVSLIERRLLRWRRATGLK